MIGALANGPKVLILACFSPILKNPFQSCPNIKNCENRTSTHYYFKTTRVHGK
jgi:hypothetical protein